jgi:hypothetical protein
LECNQTIVSIRTSISGTLAFIILHSSKAD